MPLVFPSGVIIDGESEIITFPVGDSIVLKFTFPEWIEFAKSVSDINLIFENNTVENIFECGACGTINSTLEFEEPQEEDFN